MPLIIQKCSPGDPVVKPLIQALSEQLFQITGNSGASSFSEENFPADRAVFLVALRDGEPVGCGGLRPLTDEVCEVKRMYAKYPGQGIGGEILHHLEMDARELGYQAIWLETRRVNEQAVSFYRARGYRERENYGRYVNRPEAVCFEKDLGRY